MARPVRTLMPGSSERCPRGYICGQDVYQGMIQLLQVKSEKSKCRGMAVQLLRLTRGSQWKRRVLYSCPGTKWV